MADVVSVGACQRRRVALREREADATLRFLPPAGGGMPVFGNKSHLVSNERNAPRVNTAAVYTNWRHKHASTNAKRGDVTFLFILFYFGYSYFPKRYIRQF